MHEIQTHGTAFIDDMGRQRIFNGINVCDKGSFNGKDRDFVTAWEPERFQRFRAMGINVIRLGITWEAIEPLPGLYNENYLNGIAGILDACAAHGIYAYLDMHQDLYSGFGDGPGDGAPAWACLTEGRRYKKPRFIWGESYLLSKAVHNSFDNFWNNKPLNGKGIQDYYRDMWRHVTERLQAHPALLGFDLMNEPFPGSGIKPIVRSVICATLKTVLTDSRLPKRAMLRRALNKHERIHVLDYITPAIMQKALSTTHAFVKAFETGPYSRFLNDTASAVREKTDRGIFFVEHSVIANSGVPSFLRPITPGGTREAKQAYCPHAYDLMVDTPYYEYANNDRVAAIFAQRKAEQNSSMDMPVLVGEWGGNSEGTRWLPHVEYLLALFDSYQWSQTYWCYYDGILDSPLMQDVLRRPYPAAVSGQIDEYFHDRDRNTFSLTYRQDRPYHAPTEVYIPRPVAEATLTSNGKSLSLTPAHTPADGTYTLTPLGNEASLLCISTAPGTHTLTLRFSGKGVSYTSLRSTAINLLSTPTS